MIPAPEGAPYKRRACRAASEGSASSGERSGHWVIWVCGGANHASKSSERHGGGCAGCDVAAL
jgi:hypothetical protein